MARSLQSIQITPIKACCATLYESAWAKFLLGNSFHPGGLALTARLGTLLQLGSDSHVLDVASGRGTSALFLAQKFGCQVVGVDYGGELVAEANTTARQAEMAERVEFRQGDAESLDFLNSEFDAVICEYAFCAFPDKTKAVREFMRVLGPGGRIGLSDLTRSGDLPQELKTLLAWIACITDAQPLGQFTTYLADGGFTQIQTESHDDALVEMIDSIRTKLLGMELLVKLEKFDLPGANFEQAKALARSATEMIRAGKLGYATIVGIKPAAYE